MRSVRQWGGATPIFHSFRFRSLCPLAAPW